MVRQSGAMRQKLYKGDVAVFRAHLRGEARKHFRKGRRPRKHTAVRQLGNERGGHRLAIRPDQPHIVGPHRIVTADPAHTAHGELCNLAAAHDEHAKRRRLRSGHRTREDLVEIGGGRRCDCDHNGDQKAVHALPDG